MSHHAKYDYIIIGAGIAGLHCARRLLEDNPKLRVLILEKYNYIGGRVVTFRKTIPKVGEVQWENGAGRIHQSHTMVLNYMKKYNLHFAPISDESWIQWRDGDPLEINRFDHRIIDTLMPLKFLPDEVLQSSTIEKILGKVVGTKKTKEALSMFPYRAEVNTLRADLALDALLSNDNVAGNDFGVCIEGLDHLINGLTDDCTRLGATILLNNTVHNITPTGDNIIVTSTIDSKFIRQYITKRVIVALHSNAAKLIPEVASSPTMAPVLKSLAMRPLLRIYAVFPQESKGGSWFDNKKIIFATSPIRYFIPIDPKRGICMISYTDADDTQIWMKDANEDIDSLQKRIMSAIRKALPLIKIPDPIYMKAHPWRDGCTYWLPHATIPEHPLKVMPNVWACGESFSPDKQCWMEGALENAEQLVQHLIGH